MKPITVYHVDTKERFSLVHIFDDGHGVAVGFDGRFYYVDLQYMRVVPSQKRHMVPRQKVTSGVTE